MTTYAIPDSLPILSPGSHRGPEDGACVMEFVSVLAGERFSDHPRTVHSGLAHVARCINDNVTNTNTLQGLALLAPRFIGTAKYAGSTTPIVSEATVIKEDGSTLDVLLTAWCMRRVVDNLPETLQAQALAALGIVTESGGRPDNLTDHTRVQAVVDALLRTAENAHNIGNTGYVMDIDQRSTVNIVAQYLNGVLQGERGYIYNSALHAFFITRSVSGAATVVPMLAEWLDEFDRLTGHGPGDAVINDNGTADVAPDSHIHWSPVPSASLVNVIQDGNISTWISEFSNGGIISPAYGPMSTWDGPYGDSVVKHCFATS